MSAQAVAPYGGDPLTMAAARKHNSILLSWMNSPLTMPLISRETKRIWKRWRDHLENAVEGGSCHFGRQSSKMLILISLSLTKTFPCEYLVWMSRNTNNTRWVTSARDQFNNDRRSSVVIIFRHSLFCGLQRVHRERGEKRGDRKTHDLTTTLRPPCLDFAACYHIDGWVGIPHL